MNKVYYNQLSKCEINKNFDIKYDVFKIKRKHSYYLFHRLKGVDDIVESVVYSGLTYYLLIKKDALTIEKLNNFFKSDDNDTVEKINREQLNDDRIVLNLLLLKNMQKMHGCKSSDLNGRYLKKIKEEDNMISGLDIAFYTNKFSGKMVLNSSVVSFMKCNCVKEELSSKDYFVIPYNNLLKHVPYRNDKNTHDIYVKRQFKGTHSTYEAYDVKFFSGNSKVDVIGSVYQAMSNEECLDAFEFEYEKMHKCDKESNKKICKDFKKMKDYYKEFFTQYPLNIVRHDLNVDLSIFDNKFPEIKYTISDQLDEQCLNLRILDSVKPGEDDLSDDLYNEDICSGLIVQHIGIKNLKSAPIQTSLRELIIKKELMNGQINSFGFDLFSEKEYDSLLFVKCYKNKDDEVQCAVIEINVKNGSIVKKYIVEHNDLCDLHHMLDMLDVKDIGAIMSNTGQILILKDTDYSVLPNYDVYLPEMEMVVQRNDFVLPGGIIYDFIRQYESENNVAISIFDKKPELSALVIENDNNDVLLQKVKQIVGHQTSLMKSFAQHIREKYGVALIAEFKSGKVLNENFPALSGVNYNAYFYTAANEIDCPKTQANFIKLKELVYDESTDASFFEDLLPFFFVPFVRNNMLCASPFPFKYVDEFWRSQI